MDNPSIDVLNSKRLLIIENKYIFILISIFTSFILATFLIIMVYCCLKRRNSFKSSNDLSSTQKFSEICIIPVTKPTLNESKPQLNIVENKTKQKTLIESSKSLYKKRRGSNNSLTLSIDPIKKKFQINIPPIDCTQNNLNSNFNNNIVNNENTIKNSNLLNIDELINKSKQLNFLMNEFCNIPTHLPETNQVFGSAIKNRHKTILPIESTRVKLSPIRNNDPLSLYIHANYINGYNNDSKAYIATQGPMSNTINDFWHMVWQDSITYLVMITKLKENSKVQCDSYLPEDCNEYVVYGDISVCVSNIQYENDYDIRIINLKYNNETRTIFHYWYTTWPDQSAPSNPEPLIQLIKHIENHKNNNSNLVTKQKAPILVHCSAGIGRTGCYIAIALGMQQLDTENQVDILNIVNQMRMQRGGSIQTLEQYEFVYQALSYYCINHKNNYYNLTIRSPKLLTPSKSIQKFTFNLTQTIQ